MPITPLPPYVASFLPLSNITPFTYKDGETYLKELERLEKYVVETLIPWAAENFDSLGSDFQTQVNLVIDTVNSQLAAQDAAVAAELAAQLATLTAALALKADLVSGKVPDAQLPARVITIAPGTGISVDATDPLHPIVANSGVLGVVAGTNIGVDNTDPKHPVVSNNGVRGVTAGANATVNNTDPKNPIISGTGVVQAVVAGANVSVNNADPTHPIVSATGGGGGGGIVDTVVGSAHISVNSTDAANPVVSATGLVIGVSAGTGVTVDNTDPTHPIVSSAADGVLGITGSAHISVNSADAAHPIISTTGLVDSVTAGSNITVNNTDPDNPIVSTVAKVTTVVGSANISVDSTDANNPVVSTLAKVTSVVAGTNVTVNNADPRNPIINVASPAAGTTFSRFTTQALMIAALGSHASGDLAVVDAIFGAYFEHNGTAWVMRGTATLANKAAFATAITTPAVGMYVLAADTGITFQYMTGTDPWLNTPAAYTGWVPWKSDWITYALVITASPTTSDLRGITNHNGTQFAEYKFDDGFVEYRGEAFLGSTSTVATLSLALNAEIPMAFLNSSAFQNPCGVVHAYDNSANTYFVGSIFEFSTPTFYWNTTGAQYVFGTSAIPIPWAVSDQFAWHMRYRLSRSKYISTH